MSLDRKALDGRQMLVTQDTIMAWAELGGDYNRLHVDPEYAARGPYGRTIAHGPIAASYVSESVVRAIEGAWPGRLVVELRFQAPVFVPSTLTLRVETGEGGEDAGCRITCSDQDGRTVLSAVALVEPA